MSMAFSPMAVMMGQPSKAGTPYIGGKPMPGPTRTGGPLPAINNPIGGSNPSPATGPNVLAPEAVRSTGSGPFDAAYRQDLATFSGGLFGRPGGNLSFNPTSNQPFGGAATGGGNAPVLGMPNTVLQTALGGNPFSFTPPQPANDANNNQPNTLQMQDWWNRFMRTGTTLRPTS